MIATLLRARTVAVVSTFALAISLLHATPATADDGDVDLTSPVQEELVLTPDAEPDRTEQGATQQDTTQQNTAQETVVAGTPVLSGDAVVGSTLTANEGTWSPGATFTYQWHANGALISGATGRTIVLTGAHAGATITVGVTGSVGGMTPVTAMSQATLRVLQAAQPTISGTPLVGSTLTAAAGTWSPGVTLAQRWLVGGTPAGSGSTLKLTAAHAGKSVTVEVTGGAAGFASTTRSSAPTAAVAAVGTPTVAGTAVVGSVLTAKAGTWTPGTTFTYRWLADGTAISGATSSTYTVTTAVQGRAITVQVTGTKVGHATGTRDSSPTTRVLLSATPTITGTLASGSTLTAVPGAWSKGTTYTYRWTVGGVQVATTAKLTLSAAHVGKTVRVEVIGTQSGHATATRASALTAAVAMAATPSIAGTAIVGKTLSVRTGTWTPSTAFTYQWFADGVAISGATKSSFVVAAAQSGKAITVRVIGAKAKHATITRVSASTSRVMRPGTPKITGTIGTGNTVSVAGGTWTQGTTLTYQWFADGKPVSGATTSKLKLTSAHAGKRISVTVTGRKSGHATAAGTSAATLRVLAAATPTIAGSAVAGATLTARAGTWASGTKLSYQWFADGKPITGATTATFTITTKQRGVALTVSVTGRKSGHATVQMSSTKTARVLATSVPTIGGTAQVGKTLTARPGSWTAGTALSYAWFADGRAISGATGTSLRPSAAHVGKRITVKVTGRLAGYASVSQSSRSSAAITYPARTTPVDAWTCPNWAPIKGNRDSMIYHVEGGRYYDKTKPEECFRTVTAAVNAGYRASKNG